MTDEPDNIWDRRSFAWPIGLDGNVIVEVGGFEGRWVAEMAARYSGRFHVFEPSPWCLPRIQSAFEAKHRAESMLVIHPYALGERDGSFEMRGFETDANSFLMDDAYFERHPEEGRRARSMADMQDAETALVGVGREDTHRIDVMMMNIEGYEFRLIPRLVETGHIERIDFLGVQWHSAHDPSGSLMDQCVAALDATHEMFFDYGDTLTGYVRKGLLHPDRPGAPQ